MTEEPAAYDGGTPPESRIQHLAEAPWAKVPLDMASDASLGGGDIKVYVALDYRCGKSGEWYGPRSELQEMTGLSERQVGEAISRLRNGGYLLTEPMGLQYRNVLRYIIPARTRRGDIAPPAVAEYRHGGRRNTATAPYNTETTTQTPNTEGAPGKPGRAKKVVSEEFRSLMRETYPSLNEQSEYEAAMNHTASRKAIDLERYYGNWMRKASEWAEQRRYGNGSKSPLSASRNARADGHPSALDRLREAGRVIG